MLGAIILTGGASSRMGSDKAALVWDGWRAVDLAAELARTVGAIEIVTAGAQAYGPPSVVEAPPGGGPVAGICAGGQWLKARGMTRALVLAVDAPTITAADLGPLLKAASPGASFEEMHLPMVVDLEVLPTDGAGWAMGRLIECACIARLPIPPGAAGRLRGANTPEERAGLLAEALNAQNRGAG